MGSRMLMLMALLACADAGIAGQPSYQECQEGGQFIRNAALSRDAGASRAAFVARLDDDLMLIRAFPPALRWFVKDEADELFLRAAVLAVFDAPGLPGRHESDFLIACAERSFETAAGERILGVGRAR